MPEEGLEPPTRGLWCCRAGCGGFRLSGVFASRKPNRGFRAALRFRPFPGVSLPPPCHLARSAAELRPPSGRRENL